MWCKVVSNEKLGPLKIFQVGNRYCFHPVCKTISVEPSRLGAVIFGALFRPWAVNMLSRVNNVREWYLAIAWGSEHYRGSFPWIVTEISLMIIYDVTWWQTIDFSFKFIKIWIYCFRWHSCFGPFVVLADSVWKKFLMAFQEGGYKVRPWNFDTCLPCLSK